MSHISTQGRSFEYGNHRTGGRKRHLCDKGEKASATRRNSLKTHKTQQRRGVRIRYRDIPQGLPCCYRHTEKQSYHLYAEIILSIERYILIMLQLRSQSHRRFCAPCIDLSNTIVLIPEEAHTRWRLGVPSECTKHERLSHHS